MTTNGVGSSSNNSVSGGSATKGYGLKSEDFINMMITQLQNQDPLEPAKNEELLAQMSQIGQLESSTQLQESLKSMVVQNQIGSAASLMGKAVTGLVNDKPIEGLVTSVKVTADGVTLELDNGATLPLNNVTEIAPPTGATN
jgi:flagellar basal-body rod modification protein FlgD